MAREGNSFLGLMWSTFIVAPDWGDAPQHWHRLPYRLMASILTLRHSKLWRNVSLAGFSGLGAIFCIRALLRLRR